MHQERVILRIQDGIQDLFHDMLWDIGLFGTLHCDADMVDAAGVHEGLITLWKFLVHQSTVSIRD